PVEEEALRPGEQGRQGEVVGRAQADGPPGRGPGRARDRQVQARARSPRRGERRASGHRGRERRRQGEHAHRRGARRAPPRRARHRDRDGDAVDAKARLREAASGLGLTIGVAPAKLPPEEVARVRAWIARGDHGSMRYMERDLEARADASARLLPGARSVVMALLPYPPELDPAAKAP